jgi:hypothetical protein
MCIIPAARCGGPNLHVDGFADAESDGEDDGYSDLAGGGASAEGQSEIGGGGVGGGRMLSCSSINQVIIHEHRGDTRSNARA